ncbi:hypothetical protein JW865_04150 [Candidatus Bathyarchaeota archaeon]|nr:hypothetical protein [Candidatus Bathyarchaeota archaeon]
MKSFHEYMKEYKKQMEKGDIKEAYKGLIEYIMNLRTFFKNKYPEYSVSSNIYFGYMDMTYFSLFTELLKQRKLKIALVFIHETSRFEVWLSGVNKQVQTKYWKMFKEHKWSKYKLPPTTKGSDSILENVLIENPDFNNLDALTKQIDEGTIKFINDVEFFLKNS